MDWVGIDLDGPGAYRSLTTTELDRAMTTGPQGITCKARDRWHVGVV